MVLPRRLALVFMLKQKGEMPNDLYKSLPFYSQLKLLRATVRFFTSSAADEKPSSIDPVPIQFWTREARLRRPVHIIVRVNVAQSLAVSWKRGAGVLRAKDLHNGRDEPEAKWSVCEECYVFNSV